MYQKLGVVVSAALFLNLNAFGQANWPQFRGPRAGVVEDKTLPVT